MSSVLCVLIIYVLKDDRINVHFRKKNSSLKITLANCKNLGDKGSRKIVREF